MTIPVREDYPFCDPSSDYRRQRIYHAMMKKIHADGFHSLRSYLVRHYKEHGKKWEIIGKQLGVSAGTIQRATEALKIWRKKKNHVQANF